ncbi:hypothetical protein PQ469_15810 [Mucilaginibacter sp. KACC 22773]|jgi:hypothetical protein|uniref:hypothetical protein n=1 Tax=Mucilaginibacter sp. KACC 22773 TaxID=3025671 RepID=UPI002366422A|nr:hypothetical protein [Mucilaginibacter sp. KACC 22773]WDF75356.1 hypothetical protein PQ469_15810 [Mucilaginibacter sp. KACC 22773]
MKKTALLIVAIIVATCYFSCKKETIAPKKTITNGVATGKKDTIYIRTTLLKDTIYK